MNKIFRFLSFILLPISFFSCSKNQKTKFLNLGETQRFGNLSVTIKRLDYLPSTYGLNENECLIELEYKLHSYYSSIVALESYGYSVLFDNNSNNGGFYMMGGSGPSSIAPNSDETITMTMWCFKDWKKATIKYSDYDNKSYSFSIKSSDYPDYSNNSYPVLTQGQSFINDAGSMQITFKSMISTTVGSAYAGANEDNLEFIITLTSLVDYNISLMQSPSRYYLKCDSGFSSGKTSVSSPTLPSSLPAHDSTDLRFIIILSKQWHKMVFGYTQSSPSLEFLFTINHSDVNY